MSIQQCLTAEVAAMSELASLLKSEQSALADGDMDALSETTSGKTVLLRKIAELEKVRTTKMTALGFNGKPEGMKDYFTQSTDDTEYCAMLWEKLLSISEQAKEDNRTNGLLINRRLSQNQTALNVLGRGGSTGSLYGPTGQATVNTGSMKGMVPR
ncbi:flagella synthesis protein FlgN [Undibacterium sp. RuRC25W]|uniref:flagella synthesis protein FlgN n=1 Tax=Undibacterium sp. RuRC25W TaxID=3413047 RepID=UPI003BEFBD61